LALSAFGSSIHRAAASYISLEKWTLKQVQGDASFEFAWAIPDIVIPNSFRDNTQWQFVVLKQVQHDGSARVGY